MLPIDRTNALRLSAFSTDHFGNLLLLSSLAAVELQSTEGLSLEERVVSNAVRGELRIKPD